jgi:hypothetical protein
LEGVDIGSLDNKKFGWHRLSRGGYGFVKLFFIKI